MADVKTPAAPKASTPKPTVPPVAPTANGEQPTTATPAAEKPKADKRPVQQIRWPSAEAAKAEADKRTYGPRKAFTVSIGDTTVHVVAYNHEYAAYEAFTAAGGKIEELGGTARAKKVSESAILAAASQMSPEALKALKEQLAKLG